MSDNRNTNPPPAPKSNSGIIFIVGGLVVAVGVLAYVLSGGTTTMGSDTAPANVTIENSNTTPAAPAPAEPAAPAPAEPAAPAPADPAAPAPAAPANP